MEPVKGGNLVNLPERAKRILDDLHGGSPASYAIRYAAGFDGVRMVLSGMSNLAQMQDNLSYMKEFQPLSEVEQKAVAQVCEIFHSLHCLPLLHRRLPAEDLHSRSVLLHEREVCVS